MPTRALPAFATPLALPTRRLARRLVNTGPSHLVTEERRAVARSVNWISPHRRGPPTAQLEPYTHSMASLLDGKATAATIRTELAVEVESLIETHGEQGRPGLAVVIVGERKDSMTYVRNKRKACDNVGIHSVGVELPADVQQADLEKVVFELNSRDDIDGILVQLPLPDHIDEEAVLAKIAVDKDVDGFHAVNIGRLCMSGRTPPLFSPCTPQGCMELLDRHGIDPSGKSAVVIGRSNIVGLPIAMMLMHRNATVTICHSRTQDTERRVREADIIVAACGKAGFVKGDWIKPGAVIIDVGINAVDDATRERGYRLVGDVDFEGAVRNASWVTPVPGGVGPMTIAMLLRNTVNAARRRVSS